MHFEKYVSGKNNSEDPGQKKEPMPLEKKAEQEVSFQEKVGLTDEQYKKFVNITNAQASEWPEELLINLENFDFENETKDGSALAIRVADWIKERYPEKNVSLEEEQVVMEIAQEFKEVGPGILSSLVPEKLKKAFLVGFASLSLFAASGSFSKAEAGGPHGYRFGPHLAEAFGRGIVNVVGSSFDRAIQDGYARDQMNRRIQEQLVLDEINARRQEQQMEMNMRMQERQMEMNMRMQERQMELQAAQTERLQNANQRYGR